MSSSFTFQLIDLILTILLRFGTCLFVPVLPQAHVPVTPEVTKTSLVGVGNEYSFDQALHARFGSSSKNSGRGT